MGTSQKLTGVTWRKSSYSSDTGGECIECAPLNGTQWRKSTYSGATGACVETAQAQCNATVAIRDSKDPEGPVFTVKATAFADFVKAAATHAV